MLNYILLPQTLCTYMNDRYIYIQRKSPQTLASLDMVVERIISDPAKNQNSAIQWLQWVSVNIFRMNQWCGAELIKLSYTNNLQIY